ncbi:IS110 family transposase, partial [Colwellia piezophila]|uniref:IS110 family transposase n=1 Tax=Colwellia piezophila TaxID=211668 RepID=UPI000381666F
MINIIAEFTAHIGIDWADSKHDYCIQGRKKLKREFGILSHSPESIDEWVLSLHKRFGGQIAIAVELTRGPIVYALQKYSFITIYPVNPTLLAKYREAFTPSGAKDDPTDAEFALDLMLNYPGKIKPLTMQREEIRKLGYLVEQRRRLVEDRSRFGNRLINTLKQYFPQLLELFSHRESVLFCRFINRWPNLKKLKRAREETIRNFFLASGGRSVTLIEQRIEAIQKAQYITEDLAIIEPHQLLALSLTDQITATVKAIKRYDKEIDKLFNEMPDAELFKSLPSAGLCMAPRLLVAMGENRDRFKHASEVQMYAGIAPVTQRSGQKSWVHWRWQCSKFLRQSFIEWSAKTVYSSYWAGLYYAQQRQKGNSHQSAVRALSFKWIRILFR